MASFGSVGLFHMVGVTPEARDARDPWDGQAPEPRRITRADLDAFFAEAMPAAATKSTSSSFRRRNCRWSKWPRSPTCSTAAADQQIDHAAWPSPRPRSSRRADRMGLTARIEASGALVAVGGLLLSELCARDGGGQWLAAAGHQLRQARSTSSAATATSRRWPAWKPASRRRSAGRITAQRNVA